MTEKNPFFGATFAERKAAREAAENRAPVVEPKQVDNETEVVEDKAITPKRSYRKKS